MTFIDWDPLARAGLFGGLFLLALFGVLWLWYDTSGRIDGGWTWRIGGSFLVLLTVPAVFMGAANLDADQETLLTVLGFTAIGASVASLCLVAVYAAVGRAPIATGYGIQGGQMGETQYDGGTLARPRGITQFDGGGSGPLSGTQAAGTVSASTIAAMSALTPPVPAATTIKARTEPAEAYLFVKSGPDRGQQFAVDGVATIGRREGCQVVLEDGRVSGEHAQVKRTDGNYVFTDLQSTNGSFLLVNGRDERIRGSQVLVDGDHIRVGQTVLEFVDTRGRKR